VRRCDRAHPPIGVRSAGPKAPLILPGGSAGRGIARKGSTFNSRGGVRPIGVYPCRASDMRRARWSLLSD
jgi:hypothetical protein